MCASMVIDRTNPLVPVVVSEVADPSGRCFIIPPVGDQLDPICENVECEGECKRHGPTIEDPTQPHLQTYKCCCEGGAIAGEGGGDSVGCGCGDATDGGDA